MGKPTIFFSHSSMDKEIVFTIKKKIDAITGGVLDIFLTSDGQSIPFGTNWVHKVEEGLNKATIMFLFLTPNSVNSNWVNFEAGFAYSKKIKVIPVGIGFDIAQLKGPISLLQGFNVTSGDGLNNIISVINDKFKYSFQENFTETDFSVISELEMNERIDISKIFTSTKYELLSEYGFGKGGKVTYNIPEFYERIINFLNNQSIQFSCEETNSNKIILILGIKIVYKIGQKQNAEGTINQDNLDKITFSISINNFEYSFYLFLQLMQLSEKKERLYLWFILNPGYSYITRHEDLAAILSLFPEFFKFSKDRVGGFSYTKADIIFSIFDINKWKPREPELFSLSMTYWPQKINYQDVFSFLSTLLIKNVIFKLQ